MLWHETSRHDQVFKRDSMGAHSQGVCRVAAIGVLACAALLKFASLNFGGSTFVGYAPPPRAINGRGCSLRDNGSSVASEQSLATVLQCQYRIAFRGDVS
jgi:hypothetical protein